MNADYVAARERFERAVEIFESLGELEAASRSLVGLASALYSEDRLDEAIEVSRQGGRRSRRRHRGEGVGARRRWSSNLAFHGDSAEADETRPMPRSSIAEPLEEWTHDHCARSMRSASSAASRDASRSRPRCGGSTGARA